MVDCLPKFFGLGIFDWLQIFVGLEIFPTTCREFSLSLWERAGVRGISGCGHDKLPTMRFSLHRNVHIEAKFFILIHIICLTQAEISESLRTGKSTRLLFVNLIDHS